MIIRILTALFVLENITIALLGYYEANTPPIDFEFIRVTFYLQAAFVLFLLYKVIKGFIKKESSHRTEGIIFIILIGISFGAIMQVAQIAQERLRQNNPFICNGTPAQCAAIEEHGKIAVAELPATKELVEKYGAENITISALAYKYIKDDEYIQRLIGYRFGDIHCIIPVTWPEGSLVYIEVMEDGKEKYIPLLQVEFDEIISHASDEDRKTLFDNINDDQTYVREVMTTYEK